MEGKHELHQIKRRDSMQKERGKRTGIKLSLTQYQPKMEMDGSYRKIRRQQVDKKNPRVVNLGREKNRDGGKKKEMWGCFDSVTSEGKGVE